MGRRSTSCNEAQFPLQCEQSCLQLATRNFTCLLQVHSLLAAQLYQAMSIYIYIIIYISLYNPMVIFQPPFLLTLRPVFQRDHLHRSESGTPLGLAPVAPPWRRPTPPASWRRDALSVRCKWHWERSLVLLYTVYIYIYCIYTGIIYCICHI